MWAGFEHLFGRLKGNEITFDYIVIDSFKTPDDIHKKLRHIYLVYRYGVTESFEVEDLLERRNIPKVTKCLAQLSKLVSKKLELDIFHYNKLFIKSAAHVNVIVIHTFIKPFQAASDKDNLINSSYSSPY